MFIEGGSEFEEPRQEQNHVSLLKELTFFGTTGAINMSLLPERSTEGFRDQAPEPRRPTAQPFL